MLSLSAAANVGKPVGAFRLSRCNRCKSRLPAIVKASSNSTVSNQQQILQQQPQQQGITNGSSTKTVGDQDKAKTADARRAFLIFNPVAGQENPASLLGMYRNSSAHTGCQK
jgi:hypothetical protein